ncbi:hypothetical protein SAMN05421770_106269 [Granulicella rosea]|uniref:Uncharacterized protein n=1 Tax=Granulicella rosea TaxID=474952 RepID=A0A239LE25_9BACT|nr:hypothetical protein [Granulicella rosea]SNT27784.1 hypothetical protein SAMN05421770_106269 [Granulicella rosea]
MAYTTVVTSGFFEQVMTFLGDLQRERGPIALAMLTPANGGYTDSWNLYLSAAWLDRIGLHDGTKAMTASARQKLGTFAKQYKGTWIVRTNELLVETLTSTFDIREVGTAYRVDSLELSFFGIEDAVILIANSSARNLGHKISA